MSRVFILARDRREARGIADLAGLHSSQWVYLTHENIRGHRGTPLLMTGYHCWRDEEGFEKSFRLSDALRAADCKATMVPCPPDWEPLGYRLPKGWDEPRVYPRPGKPAPPDPGFEYEQPEMTMWRQLWSKVRMGWR